MPDEESLSEHVDGCLWCIETRGPFDLCDEGLRLYQVERKRQLEREADASFEYYKGCDEP